MFGWGYFCQKEAQSDNKSKGSRATKCYFIYKFLLTSLKLPIDLPIVISYLTNDITKHITVDRWNCPSLPSYWISSAICVWNAHAWGRGGLPEDRNAEVCMRSGAQLFKEQLRPKRRILGWVPRFLICRPTPTIASQGWQDRKSVRPWRHIPSWTYSIYI